MAAHGAHVQQLTGAERSNWHMHDLSCTVQSPIRPRAFHDSRPAQRMDAVVAGAFSAERACRTGP
eukprot:6680873-Pyramimonas_sp.AAC.1